MRCQRCIALLMGKRNFSRLCEQTLPISFQINVKNESDLTRVSVCKQKCCYTPRENIICKNSFFYEHFICKKSFFTNDTYFHCIIYFVTRFRLENDKRVQNIYAARRSSIFIRHLHHYILWFQYYT